MGIAGWITAAALAPFALGAITGLVHSAVRTVRHALDALEQYGAAASSEPTDLTIIEMRKE